MCSMSMGSGATTLNAQRSLARGRQEDVGEMPSGSRPSTESLGLIWIMPLNRCAPWGMDNFLFLTCLACCRIQWRQINYTVINRRDITSRGTAIHHHLSWWSCRQAGGDQIPPDGRQVTLHTCHGPLECIWKLKCELKGKAPQIKETYLKPSELVNGFRFIIYPWKYKVHRWYALYIHFIHLNIVRYYMCKVHEERRRKRADQVQQEQK